MINTSRNTNMVSTKENNNVKMDQKSVHNANLSRQRGILCGQQATKVNCWSWVLGTALYISQAQQRGLGTMKRVLTKVWAFFEAYGRMRAEKAIKYGYY
jgi:hypothetical protein